MTGVCNIRHGREGTKVRVSSSVLRWGWAPGIEFVPVLYWGKGRGLRTLNNLWAQPAALQAGSTPSREREESRKEISALRACLSLCNADPAAKRCLLSSGDFSLS